MCVRRRTLAHGSAVCTGHPSPLRSWLLCMLPSFARKASARESAAACATAGNTHAHGCANACSPKRMPHTRARQARSAPRLTPRKSPPRSCAQKRPYSPPSSRHTKAPGAVLAPGALHLVQARHGAPPVQSASSTRCAYTQGRLIFAPRSVR